MLIYLYFTILFKTKPFVILNNMKLSTNNLDTQHTFKKSFMFFVHKHLIIDTNGFIIFTKLFFYIILITEKFSNKLNILIVLYL